MKPRQGGRGLAFEFRSECDGWTPSHNLAEPSASSPPPVAPNTEPVADATAMAPSPSLHASTAFPIALNDHWRIDFDPCQWILERNRGGRWVGSAYCVTQAGLIRNVRQRCGECDPHTLVLISTFPEFHPDRQVRS
jgi:hypothetical protein